MITPADDIRLTKAKDVKEGDWIDLEGCEFVSADNPIFEFEFVEVLEVAQETADCTAITFNFDIVGFPSEYELSVRKY